MDKLEETLARSKIEFPRTLTGEEFKQMLKFIAYKYGYRIQGGTEYNLVFDYTNPSREETREEEHISRIEGLISKSPFGGSMTSFTGNRDIGKAGYDKFSSLLFFLTPGYTIDEISKGELSLMDEIRQGVEKYFIQNPEE